jgi:hypothetical protein
MFYTEGTFTGPVLEVVLATSRFSPNDPDAFDVCVHVEGPEHEGKPQNGWWRGEVSSKFGKGNFSNKTQYEITMDALHGVGFEGDDLSTLDKQLKGKEIPYKVESREYDGKTYFDVKYIGGGGYAPEPISMDSVAKRLERLKAKSSATKPPVPESTQAAAKAAEATEEDLRW